MASRIFARQLLLILFIVLLSLFSGCKEEDSSESYYVRFNLNGPDYEFTYGISKDDKGNTYSGDACGFRTKDEGIYSGIYIIAGPSPIDFNNAATYSTYCSLSIADTEGVYSGSEPTSIQINDVLSWECDDLTVYTVTEIGNFGGVISGTFSGTDPGGNEVTDGVFYVKRLQDNVTEF